MTKRTVTAAGIVLILVSGVYALTQPPSDRPERKGRALFGGTRFASTTRLVDRTVALFVRP